MAGRHYNWHKSWRREASGHLQHTSGLRVLVMQGEGHTDFECDPNTLDTYQSAQRARGVPLHATLMRLKRLLAEAQKWREPNQAQP